MVSDLILQRTDCSPDTQSNKVYEKQRPCVQKEKRRQREWYGCSFHFLCLHFFLVHSLVHAPPSVVRQLSECGPMLIGRFCLFQLDAAVCHFVFSLSPFALNRGGQKARSSLLLLRRIDGDGRRFASAPNVNFSGFVSVLESPLDFGFLLDSLGFIGIRA